MEKSFSPTFQGKCSRTSMNKIEKRKFFPIKTQDHLDRLNVETLYF